MGAEEGGGYHGDREGYQGRQRVVEVRGCQRNYDVEEVNQGRCAWFVKIFLVVKLALNYHLFSQNKF